MHFFSALMQWCVVHKAWRQKCDMKPHERTHSSGVTCKLQSSGVLCLVCVFVCKGKKNVIIMQKILGATLQNFVTLMTRHPTRVHPFHNMCPFACLNLIAIIFWSHLEIHIVYWKVSLVVLRMWQPLLVIYVTPRFPRVFHRRVIYDINFF